MAIGSRKFPGFSSLEPQQKTGAVKRLLVDIFARPADMAPHPVFLAYVALFWVAFLIYLFQ